jgi:phosphoenolpyruvate-protein phosphotransferase (PTS system enzyme I)
MERMLRGLPASPGIVAGPVHLLRWEVPDVPPRMVTEADVPAELTRFHDAVTRAQDRLRHVRDRAANQAGVEESMIFEVQISMLDDRALNSEVEAFIRERRAAEHAFDLVMLEWRRRFGRAAAPMLRERVGDLMDLHIRVLGILLALHGQRSGGSAQGQQRHSGHARSDAIADRAAGPRRDCGPGHR